MSGAPVHQLTRAQIYERALALRWSGSLFDLAHAELDDIFRGSNHRFCEIAERRLSIGIPMGDAIPGLRK